MSIMDIYEFSERDDQACLQSKSVKQKKRKSKEVPPLRINVTTSRINTTTSKKRNKRKKLNNNKYQNDKELNPPIKLKLVRDQTDPQLFKSIQIINDISQASDLSFDFDQQSLQSCKLSDGREFALNDIVWAKISGYPFWPSKILSINISSNSNCQKTLKMSQSQISVPRCDLIEDDYIACVEWLAYDQISYVNCLNLSHFHMDFANKYSGKIKNKKYFEAVSEAKTLCEENSIRNYHHQQQTVDSVQSCETTSSTLPSHSFTSPESNQSAQSYFCPRPAGARSNPLSNQSNIDAASSTIISTNWELPDLGSNLDFESNNHIPEFSDYEEDDCDNIDIAKIEFMIDETHKIVNL